MGFRAVDLIFESVIREGLANIKNNPSILTDVFEDLVAGFASKKYGQKELNRITDFILNNDIPFVTSFLYPGVKLPCISMQLLEDTEDANLDHLDDFEEDVQEPFTSPQDLASLVIVGEIVATGYNAGTGVVSISDGSDLSQVTPNMIFFDADGNQFKILNQIDDTPSQKGIGIGPLTQIGEAPDLTSFCEIQTSINFKQFERRGVIMRPRVILGIHTRERLLTIYLYTLVKYIIYSRKADLITRGFQLAVLSGSDFSRNESYIEGTFSRYITAQGMVQDNWDSNKVQPIEFIEFQEEIQKDVATNENLERQDQSIQVDDSSEQSDD